jgi:hypothetical protein
MGTREWTAPEEGLLRPEAAEIADETLVLLWYAGDDDGQETVGDLFRVEDDGRRCAWLRSCYYCPQVLEEVGRLLDAPVHLHGCHY